MTSNYQHFHSVTRHGLVAPSHHIAYQPKGSENRPLVLCTSESLDSVTEGGNGAALNSRAKSKSLPSFLGFLLASLSMKTTSVDGSIIRDDGNSSNLTSSSVNNSMAFFEFLACSVLEICTDKGIKESRECGEAWPDHSGAKPPPILLQ